MWCKRLMLVCGEQETERSVKAMAKTGEMDQKTLDAVFESLMTEEDVHGFEMLSRRKYAVELASSFGVSTQKLDEVASRFIAKLEDTPLLIFMTDDLSTLVDIAKLGVSKSIMEKVIDLCAEKGFKRDVTALAELIEREPTEEEVYKVVQADIRGASRTCWHGKHQHSFMTDAEVELLQWASQYLSQEQIKELEMGYKEKNSRWENDLY